MMPVQLKICLKVVFGGGWVESNLTQKNTSHQLGDNRKMKKFEVISIEPTDLGNHWVITYRIANGDTDKQSVMAMDSNEAFIVFRNQMIKEAKARLKKVK